MRIPFTVDETSSISGLALKLRVDDGFVTWLNGQPVPSARHLAPATVAWNSAATGSDNNAVAIQYRDFDIAGSVPLLQSGNNLLAIQLLNVNSTSSDALLQVVLEAAVSPGLAAGNPPGYFPTPTPGAPNGGVADMILPESPAIPIDSRVFSETFAVTLPEVPGWEIRYTLNGVKPTAASTLYTGPVAINASSVLTAIYHDPVTGRVGLPVSTHYEKLESSLANYNGPGQPFRSALPIVVLNNLTFTGEFPNDDVKRPVRLQIFDRDSSGYASLGNLPTIATPANGKIRGSSSAGWPKKPYSIEFTSETGATRDLSPLGLPAGEDFALISCYDFDRAFMRNAWIYEAARQAGFLSPRFRFVEVFFNQNNNNLDYNSATAADYRGVYMLVQSIRVGKSIVDVQSLGGETGLPGVSGGYIFKFDRKDPDEYAWQTSRSQPPSGTGNNGIVIHRPKLDKLAQPQIDYLKNYIQTFENTLYTEAAAGFPTRNYTRSIEPNNWALHNIFNMFPKNVDALRLSAYFHKDRGRPLEGGILWDFDRSANNNTTNDNRDASPTDWRGTGDSTDYFTYSWWNELFKDPEFRQLYIDHYTKLRRGPLGDAGIGNILAAFKAEFKPTDADHPAKRDYARWYTGTNVFDTYVSNLQTWLTQRGAWVDSQFTPAPQSSLASSVVPSGTAFTLTMPAGTTVYYTLDGSDPRATGGGVSPSALTYSGGNVAIPTTARLRARAWKSGTFAAPATNWSGLEEQNYLVGETYATRENLRVSAIHFSPRPLSTGETSALAEADASHFEWIELQNPSDSPVNLDGVTLAARSPAGRVILPARTLAPGERAVIAKDSAAFTLRYGAEAAALITGEWTTGHELDDESADILLLERDQNTPIADFAYQTSWIGEAAAGHHAMEYIGPDSSDASYRTSSNWYASTAADGTPGIGSTHPETIHLWQFTDAAPENLLTPQTGNGVIRYTLSSHADARLYSGTGQDFPSGSGNHLRLDMPIGGELVFSIPSWGYENIRVGTLTRRSGSGAGTQHWSYSVDGLNFLPLAEHEVMSAAPQLLQLDLGGLPSTDNNPFLTLKVTFSQGNGGDEGNNRFDDFAVTGLPLENNELHGFHLWRHQKFTSAEFIQAATSGPSADPDSDGLNNLLEYALGLEPAETSVADVRFAWQGENPALAFTRPIDRDDVSYELWTSDDLANWSRVENADIQIGPPEESREPVILGDPGTNPAEPRRFLRLRVALSP